MKITVNEKVEKVILFLQVKAGVRHYEDATINGKEDEDGTLTPCKDGDYWCPLINIETGVIENWEIGKTADVHFKVCDDGEYSLLNPFKEVVIKKDGYVPDCLSINDAGYGDYIIMKIDEKGLIEDWKPNIDDFLDEEQD